MTTESCDSETENTEQAEKQQECVHRWKPNESEEHPVNDFVCVYCGAFRGGLYQGRQDADKFTAQNPGVSGNPVADWKGAK